MDEPVNQMTVEELREEIAKKFFYMTYPNEPPFGDCWGRTGTIDDESWRRFERKCFYQADQILSIFLDQTKDDCPSCRGRGIVWGRDAHPRDGAGCPTCQGTGKVGNWHPEKLVMLDKDQSLPKNKHDGVGYASDYKEAQQDMLQANFRRIKK